MRKYILDLELTFIKKFNHNVLKWLQVRIGKIMIFKNIPIWRVLLQKANVNCLSMLCNTKLNKENI